MRQGHTPPKRTHACKSSATRRRSLRNDAWATANITYGRLGEWKGMTRKPPPPRKLTERTDDSLCSVFPHFFSTLSGPFQLNIINQKPPGESSLVFLVIFARGKTDVRELPQFLLDSLDSLGGFFWSKSRRYMRNYSKNSNANETRNPGFPTARRAGGARGGASQEWPPTGGDSPSSPFCPSLLMRF